MITFDLSKFKPRHDGCYEFLSWTVSQLPPGALILECGTYHGNGTRCLASFGHAVRTYDITSQFQQAPPANVTPIVQSCLDIEPSLLAEQTLIFLDVDPHDGLKEAAFFDKLKATAFRGLLLCDDIKFPSMLAFWDSLPDPKYDLSALLNRNSGFGLVNLDPASFTILPPNN